MSPILFHLLTSLGARSVAASDMSTGFSEILNRVGVSLVELQDCVALRSYFEYSLCVYIGGSWAQGWANTRSDLDLYFIVDDGFRPKQTPAGFFLKKTPVQPHVIERGEFMTMFGALTNYADVLPSGLVQKIHRLVTGVDVRGENVRTELLRSINLTTFRRAVANDLALWAQNALDDAIGAFDNADGITCLWNARRAGELAFDANLALAGQTEPNAKWRTKKAERLPNFAPVYRKLIELSSQVDLSSNQRILAHCEELFRFCHLLNEQYVVDMHAGLRSIVLPQVTAANFEKSSTCIKSWRYTLWFDGDGPLLMERVPRFKLSERMALLWCLADRHPPAELPHVLRQLLPDAPPSWCSEDRLTAHFKKWAAQGLIELL